VVALSKSRCSRCPEEEVKAAPRMAHLPSLTLRTDVAPVSTNDILSPCS
jgi:hypothetical protein